MANPQFRVLDQVVAYSQTIQFVGDDGVVQTTQLDALDGVFVLYTLVLNQIVSRSESLPLNTLDLVPGKSVFFPGGIANDQVYKLVETLDTLTVLLLRQLDGNSATLQRQPNALSSASGIADVEFDQIATPAVAGVFTNETMSSFL